VGSNPTLSAIRLTIDVPHRQADGSLMAGPFDSPHRQAEGSLMASPFDSPHKQAEGSLMASPFDSPHRQAEGSLMASRFDSPPGQADDFAHGKARGENALSEQSESKGNPRTLRFRVQLASDEGLDHRARRQEYFRTARRWIGAEPRDAGEADCARLHRYDGDRRTSFLRNGE
jgi:hypothetical protein